MQNKCLSDDADRDDVLPADAGRDRQRRKHYGDGKDGFRSSIHTHGLIVQGNQIVAKQDLSTIAPVNGWHPQLTGAPVLKARTPSSSRTETELLVAKHDAGRQTEVCAGRARRRDQDVGLDHTKGKDVVEHERVAATERRSEAKLLGLERRYADRHVEVETRPTKQCPHVDVVATG